MLHHACILFFLLRLYFVRKLELPNKQALRLIFDDNNNTDETLLNNLNMTTLQTRRIQDMLIMVML